ncbi:MAG TPA: CHAD domain-containing protein [Chitinophagaceae bacterium]
MLIHTRIQKIFEAYSLRLKRAIRGIDKRLDHATLHDFRVGFKKHRSFLRLLSVETGDPGKIEFPDKFRKMNRAIGDIYDEQLCGQRLLKSIGRKSSFPAGLHIKYKEVKKLILSPNHFEKMLEELNKDMPRKLSDRSIRVFFEGKRKQVGGITRKRNFTDKELHSIRKLLKDMVNISKLWRDQAIRSRYVFSGNRLKDAIAVSDALGELNDTSTALSIIRPSIIKDVPLKHQPDLIVARRKWLAEKRALKKTVVTILTNAQFFRAQAH